MQPGCLLIHGFTASPPVMNYLKERLEAANFRVENPVLAGHDHGWEHLSDTRWPDWYQSVQKSFLKLKEETSPLFVAGHSLGGLLGLKLSLDFQEDIKKIACLASPFYMESFLGRYIAPVIWNSPLQHVYPDQPKNFDSDFGDPSAMKQYRQWNYHKMPIKAVRSLHELQEILRTEAPQLELPILFMYSKLDQIVLERSRSFMKEKFKKGRVLELNESGHILPMDCEKNIVADELIRFFRG